VVFFSLLVCKVEAGREFQKCTVRFEFDGLIVCPVLCEFVYAVVYFIPRGQLAVLTLVNTAVELITVSVSTFRHFHLFVVCLIGFVCSAAGLCAHCVFSFGLRFETWRGHEHVRSPLALGPPPSHHGRRVSYRSRSAPSDA
jgi:hypothetical protein